MQLTVTGHHVDVTPALRSYVEEKMGRIERHFDHVITTHVVLLVEKERHQAEANVNAKGVTLHAQAEAPDMYAAIDFLIAKLDSQVRKFKEKVTDHHRNGGALKQQALK